MGIRIPIAALLSLVPLSEAFSAIDVELQNTNNAVLTPPVVALCENPISLFTIGEQASEQVEQLAEAGDTNPLVDQFTENGCLVEQTVDPIPSGGTIAVSFPDGTPEMTLYVGAMLLPTNDAFILPGRLISNILNDGTNSDPGAIADVKVYDAGTELNGESCASIPSPECNGEGFNPEREEANFVRFHPGLHGKGEVDDIIFNWGESVARIRVSSGDDPTDDPNDPTGDPNDPTDDPNDPTDNPNDPAGDPNDPTGDPSDPTDDPNDPTDDPNDPTDNPSDPTDGPNDPTDDPNNPTDDPNDPTGE